MNSLSTTAKLIKKRELEAISGVQKVYNERSKSVNSLFKEFEALC